MIDLILVAFLFLVPAALAALTLDTLRAADRQGGLAPFESTYRAYGA